MNGRLRLLAVLSLISVTVGIHADTTESTRVVSADQHAGVDSGRYPYREKSDYILKELDLKPGDVVVDIGAGDGFWAARWPKPSGRRAPFIPPTSITIALTG